MPMVTTRLLGQPVCSDRGMWPLALAASVGAESQREMHGPSSSRVGARSHESLARCSWLLYQHVWAAAPRCPAPGPLAPCLVSSSHRAPFPPAVPVSSPQDWQQVPPSHQSHQWDLLFPPCLLAVLAAILGQGDSHHPLTPPFLSVQWQVMDHG